MAFSVTFVVTAATLVSVEGAAQSEVILQQQPLNINLLSFLS